MMPGAGDPIPPRALEKWGRERLRIENRGGGRLRAVFRFDGKTCSSPGEPLAFEYAVELDAGEGGRRVVRSCACAPVEGDRGHRSMCAFREDPAALLRAAAAPPPVAGLPLDEAAAWSPATAPSGCLCRQEYRDHKWRIVLATVRHALAGGGAAGATGEGGAGR